VRGIKGERERWREGGRERERDVRVFQWQQMN
jgi:hypothetical protein